MARNSSEIHLKYGKDHLGESFPLPLRYDDANPQNISHGMINSEFAHDNKPCRCIKASLSAEGADSKDDTIL